MSDKVHTLAVVLEHDLVEEDAQRLADAILLMKGVVSVGKNISDFDSYMAHARARTELRDKMWDILYPKT